MRHRLAPSGRVVGAAIHLEVLDVVKGAVAEAGEAHHQVEGVVDGVDDAVAVAVVGLVVGAGLEPKAETGANGAFGHHFVQNAVPVGVFGGPSPGTPPKRTRKHAHLTKQLWVLPGQIEGR